MSPRAAPAWTGIVIGLLTGLLIGCFWLLGRDGDGPATGDDPGGDSTGVEQPAVVRPAATDTSAAPADLQQDRRNAIVLASETVAPAVVSINVIDHRRVSQATAPPMLERAFPGLFPRREFTQHVQNLGSGFIVSEDGYVISNHHVIAGGDEIVVTLADGRQFRGTVQDSIPTFDLSLIRLQGAADLPVARLSDDTRLFIGEWAIAIGSPFGYLLADTQPTVTVGVISALNRDIKHRGQGDTERTYLGMIQTDAAINPGNSGGPLINARGEVIGVNTFIFSRSGGSVGVGFAVPVSRVRMLLEEVRQYGRFRQAYTGLIGTMLSPAIAWRAGLERTEGFIIGAVAHGSPAEGAGLRIGDVLLSINGQPLRTQDNVVRLIYEVRVGTQFEFVAERDGETFRGAWVCAEAPRAGATGQ